MIQPLEKLLSIAFLVPRDDPRSPTCRWGLNTMLWGDPGIGKSDRVEAAGAMVGLPVRTTYVPTCQPEDASGSPFLNNSKMTAMIEAGLFAVESYLQNDTSAELSEMVQELKEHKLTRSLVEEFVKVARRYGSGFSRIEPMLPGVSDLMLDGQGVWFMDEISSGRPAVQAGFLGAALTRRVGGLQLPPGIRVVAAGNPSESAAGGWDLEPPMANRFCHFDVNCPSNSEWGDWLMSGTGCTLESIENGEQTVRDEWENTWPMACGSLAGFISSGASPLFLLPAEGDKARGRAWQSPRTWDFTAHALATCRALAVEEETTMAFVEGCVGKGATIELSSWLRNVDLPTPLSVLTNGWKIDKKRLDRTAAVHRSAVSYVLTQTNKPAKLKYAEAAWHLLTELAGANMLDIAYPSARMLVRAGLGRDASAGIKSASHNLLVQMGKETPL